MFDFPHLTPDQRRAVTHDGGNLLIAAGAGTGKTTTLAARLAYLVSSGVAPERILLLTFSRRAAGELLQRAEQVTLLHVADGNIPSDLATGDPEAVEEEWRLLYMAMTRARNHLYAYLPLRYHHRRFGHEDPHGYAQLTRFFTPGVLACLDDHAPASAAGGPGPEPAQRIFFVR